jgi:hypothetical protein
VAPQGRASHHEIWLATDGLSWERIYAAPPEVTLRDIVAFEDRWLIGGLRWEPRAEITSVPVVGSSSEEWQLLDLPTFAQPRPPEVFPFGVDGVGGGVNAMTAGGPGLVAAGWSPSSDGFQYGAVWTSGDGINWRLSSAGPALFGPDPSALYHVEAGEPALLTVGAIGGETAAWISLDGLRWDRTAQNQMSVLPAVSDVAGGPEGFVVAGLAQQPPPAAFGYSEDGEEWRFENFPGEGGVPVGLVATVDGFLAVGRVDDGNAEADGAVWSASSLAGDWIRHPDPSSVFGGEGYQVVVYPFCKDGRWYLYGTERFPNTPPSTVLWIGTGQSSKVC